MFTRIARTAAIATIAAVGSLGLSAGQADAKTTTAPSKRLVTSQCFYEDGSGQSACYWDGGANGIGDTYVAIGRATIYLDRKLARGAKVDKRHPIVVQTLKGGKVRVTHGRTVLAASTYVVTY